MSDFDNHSDIIDSRDVIARIEELETRQQCENCDEVPGDDTCVDTAGHEVTDPLDDAELAELAELRELAEDGENNASEWEDGATLIRESYFTDYAQQLAEDIGAVSENAAWPACHIDWEAAADSLRMDYSEVDYAGVTYLARA